MGEKKSRGLLCQITGLINQVDKLLFKTIDSHVGLQHSWLGLSQQASLFFSLITLPFVIWLLFYTQIMNPMPTIEPSATKLSVNSTQEYLVSKLTAHHVQRQLLNFEGHSMAMRREHIPVDHRRY